VSPPSHARGPGTAEPALTESDDRLHLQHGVSQAGVPVLDQVLLVHHRPVQTLLPILGDEELRPVVGDDAAFAAGEEELRGESMDGRRKDRQKKGPGHFSGERLWGRESLNAKLSKLRPAKVPARPGGPFHHPPRLAGLCCTTRSSFPRHLPQHTVMRTGRKKSVFSGRFSLPALCCVTRGDYRGASVPSSPGTRVYGCGTSQHRPPPASDRAQTAPDTHLKAVITVSLW